jgi:cytochrome oxidase Cu insertion factor (SCO1/SenC/PrrC family)
VKTAARPCRTFDRPTIDDFELLDYDGNPFRLSDASDKVVLLAFWFPT